MFGGVGWSITSSVWRNPYPATSREAAGCGMSRRSDRQRRSLAAEREAAGAGVAAMALLSRLIAMLAVCPTISADELREAVDDALFSLEQGQGDSPVPQATACARQCLVSVLTMLDAKTSPFPAGRISSAD